VTGKAVEKACIQLKEQMFRLAAGMLDCKPEDLIFTKDAICMADGSKQVSLVDLSTKSMFGNEESVQVTASHSSPVSPPPFMVGMVELEVDKETGGIELLDYVAVVDCGTPINSNLVRVQTEGGLAQGIGMALYEDVTYNQKGKILENSFMQYKLPTRQDVCKLRVDFENSYEPTGPFGAKSIGEIVINTPSPAIAHAVFNATGVWHRELPITPEKVLKGILSHED
jgi:CO/xanthine dehydrogenase Mo-binding subunit